MRLYNFIKDKNNDNKDFMVISGSEEEQKKKREKLKVKNMKQIAKEFPDGKTKPVKKLEI